MKRKSSVEQNLFVLKVLPITAKDVVTETKEKDSNFGQSKATVFMHCQKHSR